jgi:hypothetical protein
MYHPKFYISFGQLHSGTLPKQTAMISVIPLEEKIKFLIRNIYVDLKN